MRRRRMRRRKGGGGECASMSGPGPVEGDEQAEAGRLLWRFLTRGLE